MKRNLLLPVLMVLLVSCFSDSSNGNNLSMLGFYSAPDGIITALGNKPGDFRGNFMLGMAYRKKKELKKAIFYLSNSCFVSHRSESLKLYAHPVYSFVKGFHRKSELYNDAVAEIAEIFFLYREYAYVVKFAELVQKKDRVLYRDVQLLKSRAYDELKQYQSALEALARLGKEYRDPDSLALIYIRSASVLEKMSHNDEAIGEYMKILSLDAAGWQHAIAVKRIQDLMGKGQEGLKKDDRFVLAQGFYRGGLHAKAMEAFSALYKEAGDNASRERIFPYLLKSMAMNKKTGEAFRLIVSHTGRKRLEKLIADELWSAGRKREALQIFKTLATGDKDPSALDSLEKICLYMDEKNKAGFETYLTRYVKEHPKGAFRDYFLWRLGRNEVRKRNAAGALEFFRQALKDYPFGRFSDAPRFWSWKLLEDMGKKDEAMKMARDLLAFNADSTYAWTLMGRIKDRYSDGDLEVQFDAGIKNKNRSAYLSAHLLLFARDGNMQKRNERIKKMPTKERAPYESYEEKITGMKTSSRHRSVLSCLEKYFAAGYAEGITRELGVLPNDETTAFDKSVALAHWGTKYNHYYYALYSSVDLLRQMNLVENLGLMKTESIARLLPRPFNECVAKSSKEFTVDENAVYAVMKAESLFYPRAVSSAGAKGLMQLMPATARGIARTLGYREYDLTDPCVSIRFGGHYIAWLNRYFKKNFDLVVAGYNAGAGNVKKWQQTLPVQDEDFFSEFIPFDETRYYVVRTRKFLHQYRVLSR